MKNTNPLRRFPADWNAFSLPLCRLMSSACWGQNYKRIEYQLRSACITTLAVAPQPNPSASSAVQYQTECDVVETRWLFSWTAEDAGDAEGLIVSRSYKINVLAARTRLGGVVRRGRVPTTQLFLDTTTETQKILIIFCVSVLLWLKMFLTREQIRKLQYSAGSRN